MIAYALVGDNFWKNESCHKKGESDSHDFFVFQIDISMPFNWYCSHIRLVHSRLTHKFGEDKQKLLAQRMNYKRIVMVLHVHT